MPFRLQRKLPPACAHALQPAVGGVLQLQHSESDTAGGGRWTVAPPLPRVRDPHHPVRRERLDGRQRELVRVPALQRVLPVAPPPAETVPDGQEARLSAEEKVWQSGKRLGRACCRFFPHLTIVSSGASSESELSVSGIDSNSDYTTAIRIDFGIEISSRISICRQKVHIAVYFTLSGRTVRLL